MYKGKIWDKKTNIGGNSPDKIFDIYKIGPNMDLGIIYEDGNESNVALIIANKGYSKEDILRVMSEQIEMLNSEIITEID